MSRSPLALLEPEPETLPQGWPENRVEDRVETATARLRMRLPARSDNAVLVDLLEDDLREGLEALEALHGHFDDVLRALEAARMRPFELLESADDRRALGSVDTLSDSLHRVQRRMAMAAARLRTTG